MVTVGKDEYDEWVTEGGEDIPRPGLLDLASISSNGHDGPVLVA